MDLDLEKLLKEELLQLFLESESMAKTQKKELQQSKSIIKNSEAAIKKSEAQIKKSELQVKKSEAKLQDKSSEVKWLTHQIAQLRRMLFGSKSERFEEDTNQMKIEFEEYATEQEKQDEATVKEIITYEREKKSKKQLTEIQHLTNKRPRKNFIINFLKKYFITL